MAQNQIIKYRNVWMGIAILWVIFFHVDYPIHSKILSTIQLLGYGGVDIFLFSSGVGCYLSYEKGRDAYAFLSRRIVSIMPTYLTFMLVWIAYSIHNGSVSYRVALGNLLSVQVFTQNGGAFNWYIGAMWLMYILTPYFFGYLERHSKVYDIVFMIFFIISFSVVFWGIVELLIIVSRISIYFLGMYYSKTLNEEELGIYENIVLYVLSALGVLILLYCYRYHYEIMFDKGVWWYPFILITPGLCILISQVCILLEKKLVGHYFIKAMNFVGKHTFELFLVHIFLFEEIKKKLYDDIIPNTASIWIKILLQVIICTIGLNLVVRIVKVGADFCTNRVQRLNVK